MTIISKTITFTYLEKLDLEIIEDALFADRYQGSSSKGNQFNFHFTPDLDQNRLDVFDALIAGFSDVADNSRDFKLYRYVKDYSGDKKEVPIDLDFKTMLDRKLFKKTLAKTQGKPTSVEYYAAFDGTTYTDLICKVDFTLTYDPLGFITQKEALLSWALEDDSFSATTKDIGRRFHTTYDTEAITKEGKDRRQSIVNGIEMPVMGMMIATCIPSQFADTNAVLIEGRRFLEAHGDNFHNFIELSKSIIDPLDAHFGKKELYADFATAPEAWLDNDPPQTPTGVTIRMYILSEVDL